MSTNDWNAEALIAAQEQYGIYVEMAEKLVDRRAEVNRLYLTLNTAIVGAIGFLLKPVDSAVSAEGSFSTFLLGLGGTGFLVCFVWRSILKSQRRLIGFKFHVIHQMEDRLPFSPYRDEWRAMTAPLTKDSENGKSNRKISFARFELYLPLVFVALYALFVGFLAWQMATG